MAVQEVIKYEGDNQTLIHKYEEEDFNTLSQLIVHESQEAVFFSDGQALDTFKAGRYTLETGNIPLISKLRNLVTGGVSPFHCEVYFVNMVSMMDIIWGTPNQVTVKDPNYGFNYNAGANGSFGLRIVDSRKLLIKYLGTEAEMTTKTVQKYFKDLITTRVKTYIAVELGKYSFNTINEHLNDISEALSAQIRNDIEPFGIEIFNFFVSTIAISEEDIARLKELDNRMAEKRFEAMGNRDATVIDADAAAKARQIQGYTWQQERQFDVSQDFAQNEGFAANPAHMMAQVPVAMAMGGMLNRNIAESYQTGNSMQAYSPAQTYPTAAMDPMAGAPQTTSGKVCQNCGEPLPENAKFCMICGTQVPETPRKIFCMNCGAELDERANFCPNCGERRQS